MKPSYLSIGLAAGNANAGIATINVVPKDWLATDPIVDFSTGKVIQSLTLQAGRNWLALAFTPTTYYYNEKPKSSKSGSYYELSAGGMLNNYDENVQQVIETLRYYELVAIVMDRYKRKKLVWDAQAGLVLTFTLIKVNTASGQNSYQVDMMMESESAAPFYGAGIAAPTPPIISGLGIYTEDDHPIVTEDGFNIISG